MNHVKTSVRKIALLGGAGAVAAAGFIGFGNAPAQANSVWDRVAECESGGDWSINTGNGYYGGLQFLPSTWQAYGGEGMPHEASKAEQISVAQNTLEGQGPGAWPVCSQEAGLTSANGAAVSGGGDSGGEATSSEATSSSEGSSEGASDSSDSKSESKSEESSDRATSGKTVTVAAGDTLGKIAKEHGVSWKDLYEANSDKVSNPNLIFAGQQLNLPK